MLRVLPFIFFLFFQTNLFSQTVYFGYPRDKVNLKSGDKIIVDIPESSSGRFHDLEDFKQLVHLLETNSKLSFRIEFNVFFGDSLSSKAYSGFLSRDCKEILTDKVSSGNYKIVHNGNTNPFFLKKENEMYRVYNTRMDLIVE